MKYVITVMLFLFISAAGASDDAVKNVYLDTGIGLTIKQIEPSRILPHAYYDQAMASIASVYLNSEILAKRRIGYLNSERSILYSMVCYKQRKNFEEVTIGGVVVHKHKSWSFNAEVAEEMFADKLLLVLEVLAKLPSSQSLQLKVGNDLR